MTTDEEGRPGGNRTALSNEQSQFNDNNTRPAEPSQLPSTPTRPEIARSYIRRNWATVPIDLGEKAPRIRAWPKLRITESQTDHYFAGSGNIGVILGEASGGLVDIDLDCPEAVALAPSHLPTTDAVFGRESKPRSHWLFRVTGAAQSLKYTDPATGETLLELRGGGGRQTVFPRSTHPSGETIEWAVQGEPSTIEYSILCEAVRRIAAGCLIKRYCPEVTDRPSLLTALSRIDVCVANELRQLCDLPAASMSTESAALKKVPQGFAHLGPLPEYLQDMPGTDDAADFLLYYARDGLKDCVSALKKQTEPGRADLLFKKSIRMGILIAEELIDKNEVFNAFIQASVSNGLVDKNGEREVRRQIEKGFKIGAEEATNDNLPKAKSPANGQKSIGATPFVAVDPASIPPRGWLYDRHYIRKFVSATIAGGGVGKSAWKLVQAISMAIGRDLLDGSNPMTRLRVWYWNGEDPKDEIQRRIAAICLHYRIEQKELEGWLFIDSGHEMPICLATEDRGKVSLDEPQRKAIGETIACNKIDVVILDPFIAIHRVSENNNPLIDRVLKLLGEIANRENCSIEIVHHIRKPAAGQNEATADDSRGGGAIVNAARSCRVLNRMTSKEAERTPIDQDSRYRYIRVDSGKQNLAPPEKAKWLYLASVALPNGDNVHVVERWQFPEAVQSWTEEDIQFIGRQVRAKVYRWDTRAQDWIGHLVAERLGLDPENKGHKGNIKAFLHVCKKKGVIAVEVRPDAKRKPREFVVPGPGQSAPGTRTGTEGAKSDEH